MELSDAKEWVLIAAAVVTMLSIAGGVVSFSVATVFALIEYRLKLRTEKRAAASEQAQTDVRLVQAFTELMNVANGRGGYVTSEKIIEELFNRQVFTEAHFSDWRQFQAQLGEFPVIYLPVGLASQDAAIAAAATLGLKYDVLKEPANEALLNAKQFRQEVAERHLRRLNND